MIPKRFWLGKMNNDNNLSLQTHICITQASRSAKVIRIYVNGQFIAEKKLETIMLRAGTDTLLSFGSASDPFPDRFR